MIDGETSCFYKGDYTCWSTHWSHESFVFQGWNNNDGSADASVGWEKISNQSKGWIETYYKNGQNIIHPDYKREKPQVKFFGDKAAYLIWKQYNADKEKKILSRQPGDKTNGERKGWLEDCERCRVLGYGKEGFCR